ncbi:serine O-acetyltransferase [Acidobacterium sp. S8]|uniref:serine O-acetyltransferase n=1 Tax=Acidobacterium sp. S8 TaxID=1641854 RepID=UPI00131D8ED2|nr:serine O-acetyltransferase [Acidobacterium sp. S8]
MAQGQVLWTSLLLNLEIPLNVFGPGLTIAHHGSIIVHQGVRAGSRCRIHPGACLGIAKEGTPLLSDDVYLGNGSLVAGGVVIGDHVVIGPHSLVRHSLEDDATCFAEEAAIRPPANVSI